MSSPLLDPAAPGPTPGGTRAAHWDVFCRVIDNHGDLGVCWRLCRDLAARGQQVRLWCDDASALAWMAPAGAPGVAVLPWRDPWPDEEPGDVVVEAFGCDPPPAFVLRMAARQHRPLWINLEYLSAEAYVERSHGLASPQLAGPGQGMTKWFFYPGFTTATGGLLREEAWLTALHTLPNGDREAYLESIVPGRRAADRCISLFCYNADALESLLAALAPEPTDLVICQGPARDGALTVARRHPWVRPRELPWLVQDDYDRLLHACDLNIVRGEDSFVRAQWVARPFLWQIYPQDDGAHGPKLDAFLQRFLARTDPSLALAVTRWHHAWNGQGPCPAGDLPAFDAWTQACGRWRTCLMQQPDLITSLLRFAAAKG